MARLLAAIVALGLVAGATVRTLHGEPGAASAQIARLLDDGTRLRDEVDRAGAVGRLLDRYFDLELIARDALGAAYARMSPDERTEYVALFREYVALSLARQVLAARAQDTAIVEARDIGPRDSLVVARTIDAQGRARIVHWRLHEDGGGWRVADVVVDGVSLAGTRASELRSVLQRNGGTIAALLATLRAQNAAMRP